MSDDIRAVIQFAGKHGCQITALAKNQLNALEGQRDDLLAASRLAYRELAYMLASFPERAGGLYEQAMDALKAAIEGCER